MSRRTKLIIAALFLVLLTIPMVYLFLTWSPERPLRFRLLTPQPKPGDRWSQQLTFELESSSAVSIHLLKAGWVEVSDSAMQDIYFGSLLKRLRTGPTGAVFDREEEVILHPHSTVRVTSLMDFDPGYGGPEVRRAMIHHSWVTHPKHVVVAMLNGISSHS